MSGTFQLRFSLEKFPQGFVGQLENALVVSVGAFYNLNPTIMLRRPTLNRDSFRYLKFKPLGVSAGLGSDLSII